MFKLCMAKKKKVVGKRIVRPRIDPTFYDDYVLALDELQTPALNGLDDAAIKRQAEALRIADIRKFLLRKRVEDAINSLV